MEILQGEDLEIRLMAAELVDEVIEIIGENMTLIQVEDAVEYNERILKERNLN